MMIEEDKTNPLSNVAPKSTIHHVIRNVLRYTISADEYEVLYKYILSRSETIRNKIPNVDDYKQFDRKKRINDGKDPRRLEGDDSGQHLSRLTARDEYNVAAIRESLRVVLGTVVGLRFWNILQALFFGSDISWKQKTSNWRPPYLRHSLSLGTILLFHRLLFRFFTRLRNQLLTTTATPFRNRNKFVSKALTSHIAPAIGASLAGLGLAIYPAESSRVSITIYVLSRSLEYTYNLAEENGWIWKYGRPAWWGSWLLFPVASGQLLYAFVYERDCFPKTYGEFILKNSIQYIQNRPDDYTASLPWPSNYEIVDNLAAMSKLNHPNFTSPILFPKSKPLLPSIAPIINSADPLIKHLSCATLHPSDPSCLRTYITYWITVFPKVARFFTLIFSLLSLPRYILHPGSRDWFYNSPLEVLGRLTERIMRYSIFVCGAIGSSWASICFFQSILSRNFLTKKRFFLGGFLGGLWAWIVRDHARGEFLYSMRASLLSFWQIGKKRGWWRGTRSGDVLVFVVSLAMLNVVFECDKGRGVVDSSVAKRILNGARGYGWKDQNSLVERSVQPSSDD